MMSVHLKLRNCLLIIQHDQKKSTVERNGGERSEVSGNNLIKSNPYNLGCAIVRVMA